MSITMIDCQGTKLLLESRGSGGIPMLFLHGLTFDRKSFASLLACLPPEVNWWTLDFRGHGGSDRSAPPYLYSDLIDDTVTAICEGIGEPVLLFGHSLGGAVALAVAANTPRWVRGLIVSDNFLSRSNYAAAAGHPQTRALLNGLAGVARQGLGAEGTARSLANIELPAPDGARSIRLGDIPGNTPEFLELWAKALTKCDPEAPALFFAPENFAAFEGEEYFPRLQCPVLLLQADAEAGGNLPDDDVELLRSIKQDVQVIQFPKSGHFMHMQDPGPTAAAISDFIRGRLHPDRNRSRIDPAG